MKSEPVKATDPMKGIPKGLCSFGRSHEADSLVRGQGQSP